MNGCCRKIRVKSKYKKRLKRVGCAHIGELSNQYKEELQLLYRLKPLTRNMFGGIPFVFIAFQITALLYNIKNDLKNNSKCGGKTKFAFAE